MILREMDYGPDPYTANIEQKAIANENFRYAVWTGDRLQMTLMCIPICGEIGLEMHDDTDQFIRIEQGCGRVMMGECQGRQDFRKMLNKGDVAFMPAGTWHNIINTGRGALKISSIYAPPNHPSGTLERTKESY